MEKKIFGILLLIAGVTGLILAAWHFFYAGTGIRDIKLIIIYGVLGIIFFYSGTALVRTTKDKS